MASIPATRHVWRLIRHPEGDRFEEALRLEEEATPSLGEGEVAIRGEYLSLDAGTRMWMTPRTDGYQPPVPLGTPMPGLVLGRVIGSRSPAVPEGSLVRAFGQWSDISVVRPEASGLAVLDETVADARQHLGVLGMNGWTAYVGITEAGRARPGETVLVSAAAGATGMLAAQIARNMGCRVIGIAGGAEKCRVLTDDLGLDQAIDYKAQDVEAALAALPHGVDVYFDNVGGPLLDAVLPNMALYGRIAVCGLVATYAETGAPRGPARFDQILMKRLSVTGFFSPDFMHRGPEINRLMRGWLEAGRITLPFDETQGLENLLTAYGKLFRGGNIGKTLVRL
ncbi:NADP-dependent oxidoreductase [Pedomonas sp. V897]|uniref:NADP-dependent oxidoreductase n=1 Tax=Pedomonas sp. V897 TaxID=3446482 RepID=UPI003EE322B0